MKNIKLKHIVLVAIFLILVVPMFNTSHLYEKYSELSGNEKYIVCYFMAIVLEVSVFICVFGGVRAAGIFFALVSLIIGMLFHTDFYDIREFDQWYTKEFLALTSIQIGISSVGYFLAEFYVHLLRKEEKSIRVTDLNKQLAEISRNITAMEQEEANRKQILNSVLASITYETDRALTIKCDTDDLNIIKMNLDQEIASLKKVKAGMSKKKQTNKAV